MIVPMKKAEIALLKTEEQKLLLALQKAGIFMPISRSEEALAPAPVSMASVEHTLAQLATYKEKAGFIRKEEIATYKDFTAPSRSGERVVLQLEALEAELKQLAETKKNQSDDLARLLPWQALTDQLTDLRDTRYTVVRLGFVKLQHLPRLAESAREHDVDLQYFGQEAGRQAVALVCYRADWDAFSKDLISTEFEEVTLDATPATPAELMAELETALALNAARVAEIGAETAQLGEELKAVEKLYDQLASRQVIAEAEHASQKTVAAVHLVGWIRADEAEQLEAVLAEGDFSYDLALLDPEADELPPTALENNKFVAPFETITNMYSAPNPYELDPNPIMSIWYWIIFGMMMGDVGYGVVLVLGGLLFLKLKKPKGELKRLATIFAYGGLTTIVWGVLYGSYFGFQLFPAVIFQTDLMGDPMRLLIICIGVGMLHLATGLLVKAAFYFKRKQIMAGLIEGVSWAAMLFGLMLFAGSLVWKLAVLKYVSYGFFGFFALFGIVLAGYNKKGIKKIFGGFGKLMGLTGYLGDILSYSRVLALALASAVIAYVMNTLAGMLQASIFGIIMSVFVYLIGHIFNLGMGLLSVYVHDGRLQYIEFFGKFYEGEGYVYEPLRLQLKYIDKVVD